MRYMDALVLLLPSDVDCAAQCIKVPLLQTANFPSIPSTDFPPGAPGTNTKAQQLIVLPCSSHNKLMCGEGAVHGVGTCAFLSTPKMMKGRKSVSLCTHREMQGHISVTLFTLG